MELQWIPFKYLLNSMLTAYYWQNNLSFYSLPKWKVPQGYFCLNLICEEKQKEKTYFLVCRWTLNASKSIFRSTSFKNVYNRRYRYVWLTCPSLVFLIAILSLDKRPDKNDIYYLFLPNIDREATLPYAWVRSNAAYKNILWWSGSWEA